MSGGDQEGRPLPAGVRRMFFAYPEEELAAAGDFVVGRLLEEGDSLDLAWLVERCGADRLRSWLTARGGRQLSRRSRCFWRLVLAAEPGPAAAAAEALWPL